MSSSQNGWRVDASGGDQDRKPIYGDVAVPNGVLSGDVAVVLRWVARRFHETVEPLKAGTCWGWYVKKIEGGDSYSNHASGTAIDLNADQHPMGTATSKTFSAKKAKACRDIVAAAGGVVRWGGDYTGRVDSMHWEINAGASQVKALADKIRAGKAPGTETEDDVTDEDIEKIANAVIRKLDTARLRGGRTLGGTLDANAKNIITIMSEVKEITAEPAIEG